MNPRLGVNIDHVATLRQARAENYPSIEFAAEKVLLAGADQITIHLREDRRHIQDCDVETVRRVTSYYKKLFNFEMAAESEMVQIACEHQPDWVCLVPEKREELTTEGGLNLKSADTFQKVKMSCEKLRAKLPECKISLFLEANLEVLSQANELKVDAVEIHTGTYAQKFINGEQLGADIMGFQSAAKLLKEFGIACHAGHGLTDEMLIKLLELNIFAEYNIGHWIISQSIFEGLESVVSRLKSLMGQA